MESLFNNTPLNQLIISKVVVTYRKVHVQNLICLLNGRLIYLDPVTISTNHLCRISVPFFIHGVVFNLLYASVISGHMGEYNTRCRLKIRFSWPRMRTGIKDWVK